MGPMGAAVDETGPIAGRRPARTEEPTVPVDLEIADGVAVVTLNDPDRRNSFFAETIDELVAAVDRLEQDESCRVLIVTGAPPAFCGGASLAALDVADSESLRGIYAGFLRIANAQLPTIAAVNGPAVGAGEQAARTNKPKATNTEYQQCFMTPPNPRPLPLREGVPVAPSKYSAGTSE